MFSLKTASRILRAAASARGIKSGHWEPVNVSTALDAQRADAVVAVVWNSRHTAQITAGELRAMRD